MAISITKPLVGTVSGWGAVLNQALDDIVTGVNAQSGTFAPVASPTITGKFGVNQSGTARIPLPMVTTIDGPTAVAAGSVGNLVGIYGSPKFTGDFTGDTGPDSGYLFGQNFYTQIGDATHNVTGDVEIIGFLGEVAVHQPSGTHATVFGVETSVSLMGAAAGATLTQAASLHVAAPNRRGGATGGSIGTAYGLKVDSPTIGGFNFAIYTESGAPNRLQGRLDVDQVVQGLSGFLVLKADSGGGGNIQLGSTANGGDIYAKPSSTGSIFLQNASSVTKVQVNSVGVGLNGNTPVAKASAIASPTSDTVGTKVAIDAICVALTNIGITA